MPDEHVQPAANEYGASWVDHDAPCDSADTIFDAMKSVEEVRRTDLWAPLLAGEGSPAILLKPIQSNADPMILSGTATMADLRHYFGTWLDDPHVRFQVESLEGTGNGAGPGGLSWDALLSVIEQLRFALEFYGAFEILRQTVRYLLGRRASPARNEAHAWVQFGTLSRRLRKYLRRRDEWDTGHLQRLLGLEPLQLGKLLRQCGFETTPERPDHWTKVVGVQP